MSDIDQPEFVVPRTKPFVPLRSRGELPHLYKENCTYFVTFRLLDAVNTPNATTGTMTTPEEIARATEPPLRLGLCLLRFPDVAAIVANAFQFFHGQRYYLFAWCVMPNHCHAVYTALGDWTPTSIHHSWKSFTSHRINRLLARRGALWERESFDHLIRSVEDGERFIQYVEENPVAAGLCQQPCDWPFSSAFAQ